MSSGLNGASVIGGGGVNGIGMNGSGMGNMHVPVGQGSVPVQGKYAGAFESSIDGFVKNGVMSTPTTPLPEFVPMGIVNGMRGVNGLSHGNGIKTSPPNPLHAPISEVDDEISDVFAALSVKDPMIAAPGYGRGRSRRSSAPVMQNLWGPLPVGEQLGDITPNGGPLGTTAHPTDIVGGGSGMAGFLGNRSYSNSASISSFNGWNAPTTLSAVTATTAPPQTPATVSSIWSGVLQPTAASQQSSRPNSQTSSYSNSSEPGSSSLSAFSPIYSPTPISNPSNGFFSQEPVSSSSGLLAPSNPLSSAVTSAAAEPIPTAFKVCMYVCMYVHNSYSATDLLDIYRQMACMKLGNLATCLYEPSSTV